MQGQANSGKDKLRSNAEVQTKLKTKLCRKMEKIKKNYDATEYIAGVVVRVKRF